MSLADFNDFDGFEEYEVQGRPIKSFKNGQFENPKIIFVQHHWDWDEFLCNASQRLEMVPMAKRVFNADGVEIDDIMCIEEDDMLFFSTGGPFLIPNQDGGNEEVGSNCDKDTIYSGVVGGFKIGEFLGRGGFGEVRMGRHVLTGDRVALKFILKNEIGSLGDVERTINEIQCLTALSHQSIIKLLRVLNESNHLVLVFELLEGGDLFHYLKDLPPGGLSEDESSKLFSQILSGVGYAHNQHVCHRDLKLENILLSSKDDISEVKIGDFGLSDFYKPGAMMKTSCGSISYLAPEVFRGTSNAGPPLDVWALGVIFFAITCGRLPFEGTDLNGTNRPRENVIRNRILRCQYKTVDNLSAEAVDLLQRMLKLDPNERATIPEIVSHPWIRGRAQSSVVSGLDFSIPPTPPKDEDTSSPPKISSSSPPFTTTTPNNEEKLPSASQRTVSSHQNTSSGSGLRQRQNRASIDSVNNLDKKKNRSPSITDRHSPRNSVGLPKCSNGSYSQTSSNRSIGGVPSQKNTGSRNREESRHPTRSPVKARQGRNETRLTTIDKVSTPREANHSTEEQGSFRSQKRHENVEKLGSSMCLKDLSLDGMTKSPDNAHLPSTKSPRSICDGRRRTKEDSFSNGM